MLKVLGSAFLGLLIGAAVAWVGSQASESRGQVCASHLRSLGEAALVYCEDNDGYLPPYTTERPKGNMARNGAMFLANALKAPASRWRCPAAVRGEETSSYGTPINGKYDYETGIECLNRANRNEFGLHVRPSSFANAHSAVYLQDIVIRIWKREIFLYPHPRYANAIYMDGRLGRIYYGR